MTTQVNLDLVWASTGGTTDPGDTKYQTGWIAEIPTYQNFNYVLQNHSSNLLAIAEDGKFTWQAEITYQAGAVAKGSNGIFYTCHNVSTGDDPVSDTTSSFWMVGALFGNATQDSAMFLNGVTIVDVNARGATDWDGNDLTISNANALAAFNTTAGGVDNFLLGNVSGSAVIVDIGTTITPDGRTIALADGNVHKIFHEGNPPTQADVSGTIPINPADGKIYGRQNTSWVEVSSTSVSSPPPAATVGAGQGWYNLDDGQFYIDIDDGDSTQWVPASPPVIPIVELNTAIGNANVIRTNPKNITQDITFVGDENGMTAGPITIDNTFTVTVTTGSTWTVV